MPSNDTSARRDPILNAPLREPGQSLREQLDEGFDETVVPWLLVAVLTAIMAFVEWVRWSLNAPYAPVLISICAVVVTIIAAWRIRRAVGLRRQQKLGLKGERYIGQFLQAELLPRDYFVIHDICIQDFNIDHAVIGPRGVFAVEVKTHSKPKRGKAQVAYDGKRVFINGWAPDRDPLIQARAGAKSLQQILESYTGRRVAVRPVVLYPGWFVEEPPGVDTWVLNETRFLGYVEHEPATLTPEESRQLANALARYVRDQFDR
jgi:hypothetical protein